MTDRQWFAGLALFVGLFLIGLSALLPTPQAPAALEVAVPPPSAAQRPSPPTLAAQQYLVRVFDQHGDPVEGIAVVWRGEDRVLLAHGRTDAHGEAAYVREAPVSVSISGAEALDRPPNQISYALTPEAPVLDFYFQRRGCGYTVRVTDTRGVPIPGARISSYAIRKVIFASHMTDDRGEVFLAGGVCDTTQLQISAAGFATIFKEVSPARGEVLSFTLEAARLVRLIVQDESGCLLQSADMRLPDGRGFGWDAAWGALELDVGQESGQQVTLGAVGRRSTSFTIPPQGPDVLKVTLASDGSAGFEVTPEAVGYRVRAVDACGTAAAAGLRMADLILSASVAGMSYEEVEQWSPLGPLELVSLMGGTLPVTLEVLRGGTEEPLTIQW